MSLRFLVDEDTPLALAKALVQDGHDAVHCRQAGLLGKPDTEVLAFARQEDRILITRDLGFGDTRHHPAGSHSGIILLRVPAVFVSRQIVDLTRAFLADVDEHVLEGALVIVRPSGYRIRREDTG